MCKKNGKICLIDLGWAVHKNDAPYSHHPTGIRTFEELMDVQDDNLDDFFVE